MLCLAVPHIMLQNLSLRAILYGAVLHLWNKFDLIWLIWFDINGWSTGTSMIVQLRQSESLMKKKWEKVKLRRQQYANQVSKQLRTTLPVTAPITVFCSCQSSERRMGPRACVEPLQRIATTFWNFIGLGFTCTSTLCTKFVSFILDDIYAVG